MANIRVFNKNYVIRRFSEQKNINGYLAASYNDYVVSMNVHPLSSDAMQALPEGERKVKRLEGHSESTLVVADEKLNRQGDLLYYQGDWYECISAQGWDHTLLSHCNYQFVLVPTDVGGTPDTAPPTVDVNATGGERL